MERSRPGRDRTLLGYAPRDPFAASDAPSASAGLLQRKAAVDFSDVFGGAPTRGPIHDARPCGFGGGGGEEVTGERSRRWSSSVSEKPVFGAVGSPAHRKHLGEDFFSDIFRGNESPCSTPRRKDRDLFSASSPGSRVLSPTRPLPPTSDVLSGGSALPAHLSYSSRLAKSFDYSSSRYSTASAICKHEESIPDVVNFPSSPNVCAPATPNRFIRAKNHLRLYARALPHKSSAFPKPLKTNISASDETDETEEELKKASTVSKAYSGSSQFHISIYRWASKGVTLIMPSNFKERAKSGSRLCGATSQVLQPEDIPLDSETVLQEIQAFQNQSESVHKNLFNDLPSAESDGRGSSKKVTEPLPVASDVKSAPCDIIDTSDDTGTCIKDSTGFLGGGGKPEVKNLHLRLNVNFDREANEVITRQLRKKESLVNDCKRVMKDGDGIGTAKLKQENRDNIILDRTENASQGMPGAPATLEDKIHPNIAKGKVTKFIKVFNQESAQKTGGTVESQARRPRAKDEVKGRVENRASARVACADEDNGNGASSTPVATGENPMKAERIASMKSSSLQNMDGSFSDINGSSVTLSDSNLDSLDASFCNIKMARFENIEECLVETLSQDQNGVAEADSHQEEIQMSETKVQEWSTGKEGNIRSLLSTLQYVLWPGSGWKPVPLVDIIEGASVRRAYQKALLCLHPDKLQQKGAEMHQKYIAEKVFDALQEAWNHFNSLSSL